MEGFLDLFDVFGWWEGGAGRVVRGEGWVGIQKHVCEQGSPTLTLQGGGGEGRGGGEGGWNGEGWWGEWGGVGRGGDGEWRAGGGGRKERLSWLGGNSAKSLAWHGQMIRAEARCGGA